MMKIDEYSFLLPKEYKNRAEKPNKKRKTSSFWSKLDNVIEEEQLNDFIKENGSLKLEEYLNEIAEYGERLKNRVSSENLLKYRESIKSFFKIICSNAFETVEKTSFGVTVFQKKYTVIKIIDEKLNKLAISILQNQFSQLDILNKLEEIQGLLVNLLQ